MNRELEDYKAYVRKKLDVLTEVFAHASIGDFTKNITVPDEDNEFTELYVGIQIILEVIREKIDELQTVNSELNKRVNDLERLNRFMVGRELKMKELKRELAKTKKALEDLGGPKS